MSTLATRLRVFSAAALTALRRFPLAFRAACRQSEDTLWRGAGIGIGEFFRPDRLCGPIVTRAMWSRIRRRDAK